MHYFFSNVSRSFLWDGTLIFLQLFLSMCFKILLILSGWIPISSWLRATVMAYWKQLLSLFFGLIVAFLLDTYFGDWIYDDPLIKSIWLNLISKIFT